MTLKKNIDFQTVIEFEHKNLLASCNKFHDESLLVDHLLLLYQNVHSNLNTYPREQIPILQMFWSCFIDYIISMRLVLETHIAEAYAILSRSTEGVGYARKMSENLSLISVWINKNKLTNIEFKKKFGYPFPQNDKVIYPEIFKIYNLTSNYGRHQNLESTIFTSDFNDLKNNKVNFNFSYIEDPVILHRCVNYVLYSYFKILSVFKEIFKDHLSKEWLDEFAKFEKEFNKHKDKLKTLF